MHRIDELGTLALPASCDFAGGHSQLWVKFMVEDPPSAWEFLLRNHPPDSEPARVRFSLLLDTGKLSYYLFVVVVVHSGISILEFYNFSQVPA